MANGFEFGIDLTLREVGVVEGFDKAARSAELYEGALRNLEASQVKFNEATGRFTAEGGKFISAQEALARAGVGAQKNLADELLLLKSLTGQFTASASATRLLSQVTSEFAAQLREVTSSSFATADSLKQQLGVNELLLDVYRDDVIVTNQLLAQKQRLKETIRELTGAGFDLEGGFRVITEAERELAAAGIKTSRVLEQQKARFEELANAARNLGDAGALEQVTDQAKEYEESIARLIGPKKDLVAAGAQTSEAFEEEVAELDRLIAKYRDSGFEVGQLIQKKEQLIEASERYKASAGEVTDVEARLRAASIRTQESVEEEIKSLIDLAQSAGVTKFEIGEITSRIARLSETMQRNVKRAESFEQALAAASQQPGLHPESIPEMQRMAQVSKNSAFALQNFGFILQDSAQFSFGFAQGLRAIANNLDSTIFAFNQLVLIAEQQIEANQELALTTNKYRLAFNLLGEQLKTNKIFAVLLGVNLLTSAIALLTAITSRATGQQEKLGASFEDIVNIEKGLSPITFVTGKGFSLLSKRAGFLEDRIRKVTRALESGAGSLQEFGQLQQNLFTSPQRTLKILSDEDIEGIRALRTAASSLRDFIDFIDEAEKSAKQLEFAITFLNIALQDQQVFESTVEATLKRATAERNAQILIQRQITDEAGREAFTIGQQAEALKLVNDLTRERLKATELIRTRQDEMLRPIAVVEAVERKRLENQKNINEAIGASAILLDEALLRESALADIEKSLSGARVKNAQDLLSVQDEELAARLRLLGAESQRGETLEKIREAIREEGRSSEESLRFEKARNELLSTRFARSLDGLQQEAEARRVLNDQFEEFISLTIQETQLGDERLLQGAFVNTQFARKIDLAGQYDRLLRRNAALEEEVALAARERVNANLEALLEMETLKGLIARRPALFVAEGQIRQLQDIADLEREILNLRGRTSETESFIGALEQQAELEEARLETVREAGRTAERNLELEGERARLIGLRFSRLVEAAQKEAVVQADINKLSEEHTALVERGIAQADEGVLQAIFRNKQLDRRLSAELDIDRILRRRASLDTFDGRNILFLEERASLEERINNVLEGRLLLDEAEIEFMEEATSREERRLEFARELAVLARVRRVDVFETLEHEISVLHDQNRAERERARLLEETSAGRRLAVEILEEEIISLRQNVALMREGNLILETEEETRRRIAVLIFGDEIEALIRINTLEEERLALLKDPAQFALFAFERSRTRATERQNELLELQTISYAEVSDAIGDEISLLGEQNRLSRDRLLVLEDIATAEALVGAQIEEEDSALREEIRLLATRANLFGRTGGDFRGQLELELDLLKEHLKITSDIALMRQGASLELFSELSSLQEANALETTKLALLNRGADLEGLINNLVQEGKLSLEEANKIRGQANEITLERLRAEMLINKVVAERTSQALDFEPGELSEIAGTEAFDEALVRAGLAGEEFAASLRDSMSQGIFEFDAGFKTLTDIVTTFRIEGSSEIEAWAQTLFSTAEGFRFLGDTVGQIFGNMSQAFRGLFDASDKENTAAFNRFKAFAIAEAIINTLTAMTMAYRQGGIFGIPLAASVGALGFAQVAKIRSMQPGGSASAGGQSIGTSPDVFATLATEQAFLRFFVNQGQASVPTAPTEPPDVSIENLQVTGPAPAIPPQIEIVAPEVSFSISEVPEVQFGPAPSFPELQIAGLPEIELPMLTVTKVPSLSVETPEIVITTRLPDLPVLQVADLPEVELPPVRVERVPALVIGEIPELEIPELPVLTELPSLQVGDILLPEIPPLEIGRIPMPDFPDLPELPVLETRPAPETEFAETPLFPEVHLAPVPEIELQVPEVILEAPATLPELDLPAFPALQISEPEPLPLLRAGELPLLQAGALPDLVAGDFPELKIELPGIPELTAPFLPGLTISKVPELSVEEPPLLQAEPLPQIQPLPVLRIEDPPLLQVGPAPGIQFKDAPEIKVPGPLEFGPVPEIILPEITFPEIPELVTGDLPLLSAGEIPEIRIEEALGIASLPVLRAEIPDLPLLEFEDPPLLEAMPFPLLRAGRLPFLETGVPDLPVLQTGVLPVLQFGEPPLLQAEELPEARIENPPVFRIEEPEPIVLGPLPLIPDFPVIGFSDAPVLAVPELPLLQIAPFVIAPPEPPSLEVPGIPLLEAGEPPVLQVSELPALQAPELPALEIQQADPARILIPDLPVLEVPELPEIILPAPDLPALEIGEIPFLSVRHDLPEFPVLQVGRAPGIDVPVVEVPEIPAVQINLQVRAPDLPVLEIEEIPVLRAPSLPLLEISSVHKTTDLPLLTVEDLPRLTVDDLPVFPEIVFSAFPDLPEIRVADIPEIAAVLPESPVLKIEEAPFVQFRGPDITLPELKIPELPVLSITPVPKFETDLPETIRFEHEIPVLPRLEAGNIPDLRAGELEALRIEEPPEIPELMVASVPDPEISRIPELRAEELPLLEAASLPEIRFPEFPAMDAPPLRDIEVLPLRESPVLVTPDISPVEVRPLRIITEIPVPDTPDLPGIRVGEIPPLLLPEMPMPEVGPVPEFPALRIGDAPEVMFKEPPRVLLEIPAAFPVLEIEEPPLLKAASLPEVRIDTRKAFDEFPLLRIGDLPEIEGAPLSARIEVPDLPVLQIEKPPVLGIEPPPRIRTEAAPAGIISMEGAPEAFLRLPRIPELTFSGDIPRFETPVIGDVRPLEVEEIRFPDIRVQESALLKMEEVLIPRLEVSTLPKLEAREILLPSLVAEDLPRLYVEEIGQAEFGEAPDISVRIRDVLSLPDFPPPVQGLPVFSQQIVPAREIIVTPSRDTFISRAAGIPLEQRFVTINVNVTGRLEGDQRTLVGIIKGGVRSEINLGINDPLGLLG